MTSNRKNLVVNTSSWHWRLYEWWHKNVSLSRPPQQLDLCRYMRTLLFWLPSSLILFAFGWTLLLPFRALGRFAAVRRAGVRVGRWLDAHADKVVAVVVVCGFLTVVVRGLVQNWVWTLAFFGGAFVAIALAVASVWLVLDAVDRWKRRGKPTPPGMSSVGAAAQFVVAKKRRICPLIETQR